MSILPAATGTAQWEPAVDPQEFETSISNLLDTPKLVKTMALHTCIALQAVATAVPEFSCPPERRGLIVCLGGDRIDYSEVVPHLPGTNENELCYNHASRRIPPLWLLQQLPNMTAAHIAREWDIRGSTHSFNQSTLPLDQGHLTARMLFHQKEINELLLVAVDAGDIPRAKVWHLTGPAELQTLST
ncbi:MAG: hypothetical protein AAF649_07275 [Verrucomicrobiota bacterium]